ncbi:MAG: hypothetical protein AAGG02_20370, partial [Cyanobacteria bacterium P01_H01_bin.15]
MFSDISLEPVIDIIHKFLVISGRPSVQLQLLVIAVEMGVAWLVSRLIVRLGARFSFLERWSLFHRLGSAFFQRIVFPLVTMLGLELLEMLFQQLGQLFGLITKFNNLVFVVFIYRAFLGILYSFFPQTAVQRYHNRLLAPLFYIFIAEQGFTF